MHFCILCHDYPRSRPTRLHGSVLAAWWGCRLTRQVSAFYDEVLRCLSVFPLNQHFDRSWTAHVAVKSALYEAESQMQAAAALHLDDDVHIEITRLKVRYAKMLSQALTVNTCGADMRAQLQCPAL